MAVGSGVPSAGVRRGRQEWWRQCPLVLLMRVDRAVGCQGFRCQGFRCQAPIRGSCVEWRIAAESSTRRGSFQRLHLVASASMIDIVSQFRSFAETAK